MPRGLLAGLFVGLLAVPRRDLLWRRSMTLTEIPGGHDAGARHDFLVGSRLSLDDANFRLMLERDTRRRQRCRGRFNSGYRTQGFERQVDAP